MIERILEKRLLKLTIERDLKIISVNALINIKTLLKDSYEKY